ncbi:MAG: molecular chaperone HtpG [Rickettsiales bacterium]
MTTIQEELNTNKAETKKFDANIEQLLQLFISSIYTNQEIFLRELLSNASDAIDKLKFMQLTGKAQDEGELKIIVQANKENKTITILDNGIGMDKDDMVNHLGTIAKSGTKEFLETQIANAKNNANASNLIGQFGVGFYSAFMIADKVEVISRKINQEKTFIWTSNGTSSYSIAEIETNNVKNLDIFNEEKDDVILKDNKEEFNENLTIKNSGTKIILHVKDNCEEFLDHFKIKNIIKTYSDNILYPIYYSDVNSKTENKVNSTLALWAKNKNEITEAEYNEFYKNIAFDAKDPIAVLHNVNEGASVDFTNLLFIPSTRSHDTFHPDRISKVKLYIKRVFITEQNAEIIPKYLRFLRGVIDCASLPLNISRETLQNNKTLFLIKEIVEKKVLSKLNDLRKNQPHTYKIFWDSFGAVLKEGLCDYGSNHTNILNICMFYSVKHDKMISLDEYIENLNENNNTNENNASEDNNKIKAEKNIYFLIGEETDSSDYLKQSAHVEKLMQAGHDVLIMKDAVDSFWTTVVSDYKDYHFISATENMSKEENVDASNNELCKYFESVLQKYNVEVKLSQSLVSTAARLVDGAMTKMHMEKFLFKNNQLNKFGKKTMEINENHPEIIKIKNAIEDLSALEIRESLIKVLFFNACIMEDYPVDKLDFKKSLEVLVNNTKI